MDTTRHNFLLILAAILLVVLNVRAQDLGSGPLDLMLEGDRFYLTISEDLLGRNMMVVSRAAKGNVPRDLHGETVLMQGTDLQKKMIVFRRGEGREIQLLEVVAPQRRTTGKSELTQASVGIGQFPVLARFDEIPSGSNEIRLDVTNLLVNDGSILGISSQTKQRYKLDAYLPNLSGYLRKEQFERGLDIRFLRTYVSQGNHKSVEVNTTLLYLEENPMTPRFADNRVTAMEFNVQRFIDMDGYPYHGVEQQLAMRYRITPKPADLEKYLAGELVEPQRPIVFYIDPATPKDLVPYFEQGVLSWNSAFEQAGFKNVIQIGRIPPGDSTFNFVSARYNALDYIFTPNHGGNADVLLDPFTNEILSSRIYWPHGNGRYLRNQYLVQGGGADPAARLMNSDSNLIGRLSEVVVAHEMGHCLGLHHNYLSSSLVSVEQLRDKYWVEVHGISPSIMDYSRHNYVAQPDDQISLEGMIPKVGAYDRWAIEWLYTWFLENDLRAEKSKLDSLYENKLAENPEVAYLNVDYYQDDLRLRMEDVGDDPLVASAYGIDNLKRVVPNILMWTQTSDGVYDLEEAMDVYLTAQIHFQNLIQHVASLVGGTYLEFNSAQSALKTGWVAIKRQKKAVQFINQQLFDTPRWFVPENLSRLKPHIGDARNIRLLPEEYLLAVQKSTLESLLSPGVVYQLLRMEIELEETYTVHDLLADLSNEIFKEVHSGESVSSQRMLLQQLYLQTLQQLPFRLANDRRSQLLINVPFVIKSQLACLQRDLQVFINRRSKVDQRTRIHFADISSQIDKLLQ